MDVTALLRELEWESRLIVAFANSPDDELLREARAVVDPKTTGWRERRLVFVVVAGDEVEIRGRTLDAAAAETLRGRFSIPDDRFVAILVGLDGGEKDRVERLADLGPWFARIDAMPMRQAELERRRR